MLTKTLIAAYVLAASCALVMLKVGAKDGPPVVYKGSGFQFNINAFVLSGICAYGLSFLIYVYLIARYDLGYIIPLTTGLVYTFVFTASWLLLREKFSVSQLGAIILILIGVALLNLKK